MCEEEYESISDSIAKDNRRQVIRGEIFREISLHETLPGQKIRSPEQVLSSLRKRARFLQETDECETTQKKRQKTIRLFGVNINPVIRNHAFLQEIEQEGGSKPVFLFQKRVCLPQIENLLRVSGGFGETSSRRRRRPGRAYTIDPWLFCFGNFLICDPEWLKRIKEDSSKKGDSLLQVWGYFDRQDKFRLAIHVS